ncbi:SDR family NAD(P)-dependent oxidoreductase [Pelagicoccus mobilis]|uniref:SDR family oxidoreductase n=1 Tax=Pelagicoccus mobilis TaxID=415221 RepID=A0A934VPE2_9BACT|nr:SDR family oxidoreductase [Pelagicoccus mobilis]MBK1875438.1 SDR family oxidoreductase [Pelagicoccus mobilis]
MELKGKTALVTGASRGIGRAMAEALVANGASVLGTSRDAGQVNWPNGVEGVSLDVSSATAVEESWRAAGLDNRGIDIVINNAGEGVFGAFAEIDFEEWEQQVGLMLLGAMKISQLALKLWSRERPGTLVNVGSLASEFPIPFMSGYNAAKAGLAAFTESLQMETSPEVVTVLELRLGDISTGFNESIRGNPQDERQGRVWELMCKHVEEGPVPAYVAAKLLGCLLQKREGVVRVGGLFQSRIAPLFKRLVSHSVKLIVNRSYYNLGRD